jgi:hypothetical protein
VCAPRRLVQSRSVIDAATRTAIHAGRQMVRPSADLRATGLAFPPLVRSEVVSAAGRLGCPARRQPRRWRPPPIGAGCRTGAGTGPVRRSLPAQRPANEVLVDGGDEEDRLIRECPARCLCYLVTCRQVDEAAVPAERRAVELPGRLNSIAGNSHCGLLMVSKPRTTMR